MMASLASRLWESGCATRTYDSILRNVNLVRESINRGITGRRGTLKRRTIMASLLAFVDIFVESAHMDEVVQALSKLDNIEELYEVTGEFDIVTLVSADDIEEFRDVLKNRIMKIKGVKSTVSSIVLKTHKGARLTGEFLSPTAHASVAVSQKD